MQIFLTESNTEFSPNEFIKAKFNGKDLRTYLNGSLIDLQEAKAGECFYIQPKGQKKGPSVTKAVLPETRGKRIAWALSFIGEKKLADSYESFLDKLLVLEESEGSENVFYALSDNYAYAFAMVKSKKALLKPALAYISDTISPEDFQDLLASYERFRDLYCPEEFFDYL